MKVSNNLLAVIAGIIVCGAIIFYCPSIQGSQRTYEVQPQVSIPEYRTDAARAIDAYERLMERYMDLTERNLFGIGADVRVIAKRLDSIDSELKKLSARMTEIEKALGIIGAQPAVEQEPQPETKIRENP
jgi:hypothetical protein